jgi:DNA-binding NtrC family response regulator
VADYERDIIMNTLEQNRFNLTKTAEDLKLSRHALRYRMQRLNLQSGSESEEAAASSAMDKSH